MLAYTDMSICVGKSKKWKSYNSRKKEKKGRVQQKIISLISPHLFCSRGVLKPLSKLLLKLFRSNFISEHNFLFYPPCLREEEGTFWTSRREFLINASLTSSSSSRVKRDRRKERKKGGQRKKEKAKWERKKDTHSRKCPQGKQRRKKKVTYFFLSFLLLCVHFLNNKA